MGFEAAAAFLAEGAATDAAVAVGTDIAATAATDIAVADVASAGLGDLAVSETATAGGLADWGTADALSSDALLTQGNNVLDASSEIATVDSSPIVDVSTGLDASSEFATTNGQVYTSTATPLDASSEVSTNGNTSVTTSGSGVSNSDILNTAKTAAQFVPPNTGEVFTIPAVAKTVGQLVNGTTQGTQKSPYGATGITDPSGYGLTRYIDPITGKTVTIPNTVTAAQKVMPTPPENKTIPGVGQNGVLGNLIPQLTNKQWYQIGMIGLGIFAVYYLTKHKGAVAAAV